jgi:hypothetical protein
MAVRILSLVWDQFPGGGSDLLALLALADWSDDNGRCYPSMNAIARKTRLSRSQAQRVVHRLIKDGYLQVTANALGGSPKQTCNYRIVLSHLSGRADATATGSANATGRTDAAEGSHGCGDRGSAHATQTVSEPSTTVRRTPGVRKTVIPADFEISERVKKWASEKGFGQIDEHLDAFKRKCQAKGYTYADWEAAFMEAVREDWASLRKPASSTKRLPQPENFSSRDYGKGGRL